MNGYDCWCKCFIEKTKKKLLTKITKNGECWQWFGNKDRHSYGKIWIKGKLKTAHRVSYEIFVGEIKEGMAIDHICRNRSCINPKHLRQLTWAQNAMASDGICPTFKKRTHCKNGHPFSGSNLVIYKNQPNARKCRTCIRTRWGKYVPKSKRLQRSFN